MEIYQTTIDGRPLWAARCPVAWKRDPESRSGDTLHLTREEAEADFTRMQEQDARYVAREAERTEQARIKAEEKAKIDADDFNGFLTRFSPMQKARVRGVLNKWYAIAEFTDGISVRDFIENRWKAGSLKVSSYEENRIQPMSARAFFRADGRQQAAHEKRVREAGTKTAYLVNGIDLGKYAYDYASHLIALTD